MKTLYIVHGLKRSGNHAIINWLLDQAKMPFYNNIIPISPILTGQQSIPPPVSLSDWLRKQEQYPFARALVKTRRRMMVSLEDHRLSENVFLHGDYTVVNILVLRDPVNLFASRIRKSALTELAAYPNENNWVMHRARELWIEHAREFLGETNCLGKKVCILFNNWFVDQYYRQGISAQLGFRFKDSSLRRVSAEGGGSSFDLTLLDGQAEKLDVLGRKNRLSTSEQRVLEEVLACPELTRLSKILETHNVANPARPGTSRGSSGSLGE